MPTYLLANRYITLDIINKISTIIYKIVLYLNIKKILFEIAKTNNWLIYLRNLML